MEIIINKHVLSDEYTFEGTERNFRTVEGENDPIQRPVQVIL